MVLVDKETRRPAPIEDKWRELYQQHCVRGEPLIIKREDVPDSGPLSIYEVSCCCCCLFWSLLYIALFSMFWSLLYIALFCALETHCALIFVQKFGLFLSKILHIEIAQSFLQSTKEKGQDRFQILAMDRVGLLTDWIKQHFFFVDSSG